jgi:hypothetical protein
MAAPVGATVVAAVPHIDLPPAPAEKFAQKPAVPPPDVAAVDPWALRDGIVTSRALAPAVADPQHPLWTQLFHHWAAKRGPDACDVPQAVPRGRSPRDALFDLLSVLDVWRAAPLRLDRPSVLPYGTDVCLTVFRTLDGASVELPAPAAAAARLRERGIDLLHVCVVHGGTLGGPDVQTFTIDAASGEVTDSGAIVPAAPFALFIDFTPEDADGELLDARDYGFDGTAALAACRCAFRLYVIHDNDTPATAAYWSKRLVPTRDRARERVAAGNIMSQLIFGQPRDLWPACTEVVRADIAVEFTLDSGTMRFAPEASLLRSPGSAPVALFFYPNEQWSQEQALQLCATAVPPLEPPYFAPGTPPPAAADRQRFGHVRAPRSPPVPITLHDPMAYIEPLELRGRVLPAHPAWLGLALDTLHPNPARVRAGAATLHVLDPQRTLRRLHSVLVHLRLRWRLRADTPFADQHVHLRFQLVHAREATYAYAGAPPHTGGLPTALRDLRV